MFPLMMCIVQSRFRFFGFLGQPVRFPGSRFDHQSSSTAMTISECRQLGLDGTHRRNSRTMGLQITTPGSGTP